MNSKYEMKTCPRCGKTFECKPGNITQCQCYRVSLTREESVFIKEIYDDCLCAECLESLKIIYKQKRTIKYFETIQKEN